GNIKKFYHYCFPMQAALIACKEKKEKTTNIITVAWHTPLSKKPPLYGASIAPERYTHKLIENKKEFTINFAPIKHLKHVHFCGTHTGKNTDKIQRTNLTISSSKKIDTPVINECYAHLECKLYDKKTVGDHTFFIGRIVNVLFDENAFRKDILDNRKIKPCYYLGSNQYTTIAEKNILG
ncbi:MAG: flavin reductase family protein, partial [Candidatus Thermoplasmatota archaeon]